MQYKWIVLSNTTIAMLMASLDGTIVLISLPAIFNGLQIDPLSSFQYLLWILFGYSLVTATLLVTFGRISDIYGRVKLYNLGFAVFTIGSVLGYLTPNTGDAGALELIVFRMVQGVGAAFLFANGVAILTDAFPEKERGQALGINMVALIAGSMLGLTLGGVLATINWRWIFLVNVPIGVFATAWAYLKLKEVETVRRKQKIDFWGNLTFGGGLTLLMLGVTYGLLPYGTSYFGWGSPWVIGSMLGGAALLVGFVFIEGRVKDPMFRLDLFKINAFRAGNIASFLSSIGRGGTQIMLIILLQGIWLPLHGYAYKSTPFWSGLYITPLLLGFVVMGPISGRLADRRGARGLATGGMLISATCLLLLTLLPYDFIFWQFALILFVMGLGGGLFASPNTVAIMNSVPPETRGAASGMRATVQNTGMSASTAVFFSIVLVALGVEPRARPDRSGDERRRPAVGERLHGPSAHRSALRGVPGLQPDRLPHPARGHELSARCGAEPPDRPHLLPDRDRACIHVSSSRRLLHSLRPHVCGCRDLLVRHAKAPTHSGRRRRACERGAAPGRPSAQV